MHLALSGREALMKAWPTSSSDLNAMKPGRHARSAPNLHSLISVCELPTPTPEGLRAVRGLERAWRVWPEPFYRGDGASHYANACVTKRSTRSTHGAYGVAPSPDDR